MNRRRFLSVGAAGALGLVHGARLAAAQDPAPAAPQEPAAPPAAVPYGETPIGLDDERDGTLYVPKSYKPGVPMPLLMMLHGLTGGARSVRYTQPLAEEFGVIVIAPESRDFTWGQSVPGFDADVRYLGAAYRHVREFLDVDRSHVALGGHSDGAGYALSMGLAYGDTFNHLLVFSGGLMVPFRKQGQPKIFLAHGVNDKQMPIDKTARRFVPQLRADGYDLTYREYEGGHGVPPAIVREGFEWFLAGVKRPSPPA
jgi:phospholipase/carboxylesterase